MDVSQVYHNATNAFQNDPELRNLLMATMESASAAGMPPMMQAAQAVAQSGRPMPPGAAVPPPVRETRMDKAPMPAPAPPAYDRMAQFGPTAASIGGPASSAPAPAPMGAISAPNQRALAAAMPAAPKPSTGQQIAAFLQGLGSSDAILPAIGGGMAAVENLEKAGAARNQTVRALMGRGLDADTALAAAQNPEVLKAVLPTLFGGEKQMGSIYDSEGREQKGFYDKTGAWTPVGGPKRDAVENQITAAQGKANIKRLESYKSQADDARAMMGTLNQIKELRKGVPDAIKGLPQGLGSTITGLTDYFGITEGARALSPQELSTQLSFTERTKGAITDREMAMFATAVPGLGMTDAAADKVIAGMEATAQRSIERAKFFEAYMQANRNSLTGAQEAWDAYTNANPIIVRNQDGTLGVNAKNIGNWRDYVEGGLIDGDPISSPGAAAGDVGIEGAVGEGTGGTAAPPDLPNVTTAEERDALEPGAEYLYQGRKYRKPRN